MKKLFLTFIIASTLFLQGCLLFHSVEYKVVPDGKGGGEATLVIEDIRSDAINNAELNDDKKNLFEFIYKSDDFINQMKEIGRASCRERV